jgi:hypothetical protein
MKNIFLVIIILFCCNKSFALHIEGTQTSKEGCKVTVSGDVNILTGHFTGTSTVSGPNPPCVNGTMTFTLASGKPTKGTNKAVFKFMSKSNSTIINIEFTSSDPKNADIVKTISEKNVIQGLIKTFNAQIRASNKKNISTGVEGK